MLLHETVAVTHTADEDAEVPASWTVQAPGRPAASEAEEENHEDTVCMICFDGTSKEPNSIVFCDGCNMAGHQACYGIKVIPEGDPMAYSAVYYMRSSHQCRKLLL
jgi:hypothetical protein